MISTFGVIASAQLTGGLSGAVDAVLGQLAAGGGIDAVADLLGTGGGRSNLETAAQTGFGNQILHNKFGHGTAADVAVANEKYFDSVHDKPPKIQKR